MTLRQLFESTPFDNLVPVFKGKGYEEDLCHYKQAYDILRHIESVEDGCKDVDVDKCQDDPYGDEYISASQIEGDWWTTYIDGEVILEEGIDVSQEELAFKLLWHLTYYGYSPEDIQRTLTGFRNDDYHDTKYGRMARSIDRKRTMNWANKEIRARMQKSIREFEARGETTYGLPLDDWRYINNHKMHCNRMKRMRDHRQELRLKVLTNMDRCENTMQCLLDGQSATSVTRDDLAFLWDERGRIGCEFQSRAYDVARRLDYLGELVCKYGALRPVHGMDRAVVKISTSSEHDLSQQDFDTLIKMLSAKLECQSPIIIRSIQESLGMEVGIMIVGN